MLTFHSEWSTLPLYLATSLHDLRMEYSYHNSYVMPELTETTQALYRARTLKNLVLEQGYIARKLKSSLQKFYGRHHELVDRYDVSICTMETDFFNGSWFSFLRLNVPDLTFFMSNSADVSRKAGEAYSTD